MKILVVSNLYPPIVRGGYEAGCGLVVKHLRERNHEVRVLASSFERDRAPSEPHIERTLTLMSESPGGSLYAPLASLRAVAITHRALTWRPELVYAWNCASLPQATLRIIADSGVPLAFRVEEHWFASLFVRDQFLRELLPADRGPTRAAWSHLCRIFNKLPALRLTPTAGLRAAVNWNSEAMRAMAPPPPFVDAVLERMIHPAPPNGDLYAAIERRPGSQPRVCFVGRVTPTKGLEVAIRALALLNSEIPTPATLDVIGPEEPEHGAEMRKLAERLGITQCVHWHGQRTAAQTAALLAGAHAMIVPSTWDEPFGYVTIEAALARVPLVAADVGGIGEAVRHERHALLFPRADVAAAAAALRRVLLETEQTSERVARAYERAQEFRVQAYIDRQERFVVDALDALRT
jgi:glycosyltransferase involved in cell wall biosynthesis